MTSFIENKYMKWQPLQNCQNSCRLNVYDAPSIRTSIKKNYNIIQIYGDSRARQFFQVLKSILLEHQMPFQQGSRDPAVL